MRKILEFRDPFDLIDAIAEFCRVLELFLLYRPFKPTS
jgi:hypothetical protein